MWQWVYCIFAQTALMVAISPRHAIFFWLRAVSSQNYVIVLMSYERIRNKEKYVPIEKTFIPGTIKRHIFILNCAPKLIQCGIPINYKRQISDWIISTENREERLVGLGKLLGILSEKYVLRLFRISTLFPFIFVGDSFVPWCHFVPFWSFQGGSHLHASCGFLIVTSLIWIASLISHIFWLCLDSYCGANFDPK